MTAVVAAKQLMRAAVIAGAHAVEIRSSEMPVPRSGEVRLRIDGCGVCASNLPVWQSRPWFQYPLEPGNPGHEGWGWIDAVGDAVEDLGPGDHVAFLSSHAYAEYDIAQAGSVVKLPPSLEQTLFPGEAIGCAMNVFRRSDIRRGQTVCIVGIGFLGAILVKLASDAGANVIAVSRRAFALEVARAFGASMTIPMDDHEEIVSRVMAATNGRGCERVIEVVGLQRPLDLATELTAERGRLVIAGYHQDGLRQVNMQLWNWRGLDVVNAHERDPNVYVEGIRAAIDLVASGNLDLSPLYTTFPLDQIDRAFDALENRSGHFLKAVVKA